MLMNTNAVAKKYNATRASIMNYRKLGMPHTKLGGKTIVYDELEVEEWIKANFKNGRYSKFTKE